MKRARSFDNVHHIWFAGLQCIILSDSTKWFTRYEAKSLGKVRFGNSHKCDVIGIGDISVHFSDGSHLTMENVHHAPQLSCSWMSIGHLDDNRYKVIFASHSFLEKGNIVGSLYPVFVHQKEHLLVINQLMMGTWHGLLSAHVTKWYGNSFLVLPLT